MLLLLLLLAVSKKGSRSVDRFVSCTFVAVTIFVEEEGIIGFFTRKVGSTYLHVNWGRSCGINTNEGCVSQSHFVPMQIPFSSRFRLIF